MEIVFKHDKKENIINLEKNVIFFGQNNSYKTNFINGLVDAFNGKNKNIIIDGKSIDIKDYNVIYINEETDFLNEFKFTKNNTLKQLIYDDIIDKINGDKLIECTNELFDVIDNKVNRMLDRKVNKNSDSNISFQVEIPNINSIIDKFTNIYIDDILVNSNEISKSMKRKLLYQLYFLDIKNNDKCNIIIIENFDAYLNSYEIINFLNKIKDLTSENCHFILTSCNNIFEYVDLYTFSIYKIFNKLISLECIDEAIKIYLIKREYVANNVKEEFGFFYNKNEGLISNEEILSIRNIIINKHSNFISKILNYNSVKIVSFRPKNISCEYIVCNNKDLESLYLEISNKFID